MNINGVTIFLIVWVIIATFLITSFYRRGKRALSIFPDINSVMVKYRDMSASGYSTKNWITKRGRASGVLDIVVTDDELWLKSMLLFAGILKKYDLLHKIPLKKIMKANNITGRKVTLDFKSETGENKQVVLITKRPDELIRAIKNNNS
ncbi:MAG TPA: hypothetical protein VE978_26720 [Chitinophagales bacterium]|nr:hypothetical protein [Chitinophagales bacterium]